MDVTINSQKRFNVFLERVAEHGLVWGLKSADGWCVCESNEYENTVVMLFWPDKAYARQCAVEEWAHYQPAAIPLNEFLELWLPGLNEDGLLAGVNWNVELVGLEVEPEFLLEKLEEVIER